MRLFARVQTIRFSGSNPLPDYARGVPPRPQQSIERQTYYNLVPWSGNISVEDPSAPAQGISGYLESVKSHHHYNRIAAADPKHVKAQELKRIEEARAANCCT